ncbi:MAG TPA: Ppx/GppA family phosphatase [Clostridiales bacterium UBA8960]|jgi:exopolyphosphatase/guanosine-5'-triphosphate,3'-diphosphate pyrophosphatase|nr:Ppx/GppA family phosphatase [Clostridiales bacterium UBA8960]
MKIACIDTGTNSIRLLLGEYDGVRFSNVTKKLQMTRLGKGVNETKLLDMERVAESVDVIAQFYVDAKTYGAEHVHIMATSAVRDAKNADVLRRMILDRTGLVLEVISGKLEAEVGFMGVLNGSPNPDETVLVIDIGGGSTELIVGNKEGLLFSDSIDIGAVRLTGKLIKHDPPTQLERMAIEDYVKSHARETVERIKAFGALKIIGIGGTATTIATIEHEVGTYLREVVHGLEVRLEALAAIDEKLERMTVAERKQMIGLDPKRADIIFAGGIILKTLLEMLESDGFTVSDYDNLEGFVVYKKI